jgi:hypothetical protein
MQLTLGIRTRPDIFLPFRTRDRQYYLLLSKHIHHDDSLFVQEDEAAQASATFFQIGRLTRDGYDGEPCGHIFYTTYPVTCHGTSLIAYSKVWSQAVNNRRVPIRPFGVALTVKSESFLLYHRRNQVTLVVSPKIAANIKANLEV